MYENQLGALTNQQFNVEQTNFALQSMQDNVQTVRAMQAAGKQLKQNFKQPELNINKIENMQDDMADLMVRPTVVGGTGSVTVQGQHCDLSLLARGCLLRFKGSLFTGLPYQTVAAHLRLHLKALGDGGGGLRSKVEAAWRRSGQTRWAAAQRVVDCLRCLQDRNQEIQDVLGQNFGVPDDIDEDELMGELDALEDDMATELDAGPGGVPSYMQVGALATSVPAVAEAGVPGATEVDAGPGGHCLR